MNPERIVFLTCAMLLASIAPCFVRAAEPPSGLVENGTLTFCSDMQNPPIASMGPEGREAQGIGVDIMDALAERMGLAVRIRNYKPSGIFAALDTGKCDAIMASMSRSPEREQRYDFVDYFQVASDLLLNSQSQERFPDIESLSGRRVAVLLGGRNEAWLHALNERFAAEGRAPVNIIALNTNVAAFQDLELGRVHAFLCDTVIVSYYQSRGAGRFVTAGLALRRGTTLSIVVGKGRPSLRDALQTAMDGINDDGRMQTIIEHWGIGSGVRACTRAMPCE